MVTALYSFFMKVHNILYPISRIWVKAEEQYLDVFMWILSPFLTLKGLSASNGGCQSLLGDFETSPWCLSTETWVSMEKVGLAFTHFFFTVFGKLWGVFWEMGGGHVYFSQMCHLQSTQAGDVCLHKVCLSNVCWLSQKNTKVNFGWSGGCAAADRAACWSHEEGLTDNAHELQPTLITAAEGVVYPLACPLLNSISPAAVFF